MTPVAIVSGELPGKHGSHKVSLACNFCRSRKRKCDGVRPVCGYCRIMKSTTCAFDIHSDKRKLASRSYVSALEARIKTLEEVIRATADAEAFENTDGQTLRDVGEQEDTTAISQAKRHVCAEAAHGKLPEDGGADIEAIKDMGRLRLCVSKTEKGDTMNDEDSSNFCYYGPTSSRHLACSQEPEPSLPHTHLQCDPRRSLDARTEMNLFENEYELGLLNKFWVCQDTHATIVDRTLFLESYEKGERDSEWVSPMLIDMMLAIGEQLGHQGHEDRRVAYAARAEATVVHELGRPRMATMQAVQLMAIFQMGAGRISVGWSLNGLAVALSNRLGLHIDSTDLVNRGAMSKNMKVMRDMAFWGIFALDRLFSIIMGLHPLHSRRSLSTRRPLGSMRDNLLPANLKLAGAEPEEIISQHTFEAKEASEIWFRDLCDIVETILVDIYAFDSPDRTAMDEYNVITKNALVIQTYMDNLPKSINAENAIRASNLRPISLHIFVNLFVLLLNRPFLGQHHRSTTTKNATRPVSSADKAVERRYRSLAFGYCHTAALRIIVLAEHYMHAPCLTTAYVIFSACTILLLSPHDPEAMKAVRTGLGYLDRLERSHYWVESAKDSRRRILALAERWKVQPLLDEPDFNGAAIEADASAQAETVNLWDSLPPGFDWHTLGIPDVEMPAPDIECDAFTGPDASLFAIIPSTELGAMYTGLSPQVGVMQEPNSRWFMGSQSVAPFQRPDYCAGSSNGMNG